MSFATLGLSTYRWNNNLKSVVLLAAFPLLLIALLWLFFYLVGSFSQTPQGFVDPQIAGNMDLGRPVTPLAYAQAGTLAGMPFALGVAALWLVIGTLFHDGLIRAATHAASVSRAQQPELYNLLENLCISRGIAMPKLCVIDTPVMNAYASGLGPASYSITVTRGLLERLDKDEMEAVLAHELSHIMNKDVRLMVVAVLFGGMLSFFAEMLWRSLRFSSSDDRRGRGTFAMMLIAGLLLLIGTFVSYLLRLALSRRREYLADAGAVALTKRPEALIHALEKIAGNAAMPDVPSGVQAMMIENPPTFFDFLDTHPPVAARIAVLRRLGGIPQTGESIIPQTGK